MTKDLERRIDRFDKMASMMDCERPSPLIIKARIKPELFDALQYSVGNYMAQCLPDGKVFTNESGILNKFRNQLQDLKNRSRNGTLVPKRELTLEYNIVFRAYGDIIKSFNLPGLVSGFTTLTVRHQKDWSGNEHARGGYATENPHSDAWIGESPFGMNTITPVFGDLKNNNVNCFAPPANFSDDWLKPLSEFKDGSEIFSQYNQVPTLETSEAGFTYFLDFAVIHQSNLRENAWQRVSLDNFSFHNVGRGELEHPSHPRLSYDKFCNIGREEIMTFWPSLNDPITDKNANFHKTWKLVKLNE